MIGQKIGSWTIVEKLCSYKNGANRYKAVCFCGAIRNTQKNHIKGHPFCYKCYLLTKIGEIKDSCKITKIITKTNKYTLKCGYFVEVQCKCSRISIKYYSEFIKSPGCRSCAKKKHGLSGTREIMSAHNAIYRCINNKRKDYFRYGGRGIKVYEPWINDPYKMAQWMIDNLGRKTKGMHLDRIDNDGNYVPGNLRYVTRQVNNNNRYCSPKYREDQILKEKLFRELKAKQANKNKKSKNICPNGQMVIIW